MEALKRFRSRKKSRTQADTFTSFADADSNYGPISPTWNTSAGRPSTTKSRPSDAGRMSALDDVRQMLSPTSERAAGSVSRVQPMLIGISRPSATHSRPGTAESLQHALDRAADSVAQQPALPRTISQPSSPAKSVNAKSARHIDIFSIAGQTSKPTTTFNEDIAERNLDTLAMSLEENYYRYKPSSKYQEEVASRNVRNFALDRTGSVSAQVHGHDRTKTTTSIASIHVPPSTTITSHAHRILQGQDNPNPRTSSEQAAHQRQTWRSRDTPEQLPSIPQERSSEDGKVSAIRTFSTNMTQQPTSTELTELECAQAFLAEQHNPNHYNPVHMKKDSVVDEEPFARERSPVPRDAFPNPARLSANSSATRSSGHAHRDPLTVITTHHGEARDSMSSYQYTAQDARRAPYRSSDGGSKRNTSTDAARRSDNLRPPSTLSNTSSMQKKTVGNRTIMDLTGDDSEAFSVLSYSGTPVLQNARWDAFQKLKPAVVETHSPKAYPTSNPLEKLQEGSEQQKDEVIPNARWSSAHEPVLDIVQLARRSQMVQTDAARRLQEKIPELPKIPVRPKTPPRNFTFSPINTVSSISPRASLNRQQKVQTSINASSTPGPREAIPDVVTQNLKSEARSSARISPKIAPLVKVFADVAPEEAESTRSSSTERPPTTSKHGKASARPKIDSVVGRELSAPKVAKQAKPTQSSRQPSQDSRSVVSPNPHEAEGVKARDFAIAPLVRQSIESQRPLLEKTASHERSRSKQLSAEPVPQKMEPKKGSGERKARIVEDKKVALDPKPRVSDRTKIADLKVKEQDEKSSSSRKSSRSTKSRRHDKSTTSDKSRVKTSSGKSTKQNSSAARKARPVSVFDEDAFKRKQADANAALLRLQMSLTEDLETSRAPSEAQSPAISREMRSPNHIDHEGPVRNGSQVTAPVPTNAKSPSLPQFSVDLAAHNPTSQNLKSSKQAYSVDKSPENRVLNPLANTKLVISMNPLLARLDANNKPPPSPGEVSLSAFPLPTRETSPEVHRPMYSSAMATAPVRRGSQTSRVSSASTFSIPFSMVPGRGSSLTQRLAMEPPRASAEVQ